MSRRKFKGTVSRDFLLQVFFHESPSPKPLIITLGSFQISKIHGDIRKSRCTTGSTTPVANLPPVPLVLFTPVANWPPVSTIPAAILPPLSTTPVANCHRYQRHRQQICHRCQWHRWQIIVTISGCRHLKVNLKAKFVIYVSSTTQRWPNKIIKIFLIEDFFHLPPLSLTKVANLELKNLEKIWNGLNGILWGWGETDSWKEPEAKNLVTLSLKAALYSVYLMNNLLGKTKCTKVFLTIN